MEKRAEEVLTNDLIFVDGLKLLVIANQYEGENNVLITCHHSPRIKEKGPVLLKREKNEMIEILN